MILNNAGSGANLFVFNTHLEPIVPNDPDPLNGIDLINGFQGGVDEFMLDRFTFSGLGVGIPPADLDAAHFVSADNVDDADLLDGNGTLGDAVQFAQLGLGVGSHPSYQRLTLRCLLHHNGVENSCLITHKDAFASLCVIKRIYSA